MDDTDPNDLEAQPSSTRHPGIDHVLTSEELLLPEQFPDAIAAGAYPIDIHPPAGGELRYEGLGADHAYQIPYRSLIPVGFDNALVVGRGVSATHSAHAAIRVMTISMAVGQAAGVAAAMAVRHHGDVRAVSIPALRERLLDEGAKLA